MLKALPRESWENYGMHAERGKETIAHVVRMFAGHDTNHVRQIEGIVCAAEEEAEVGSPRCQGSANPA